MINIYGLKNCDSCRKALKWLDDNNYSYEFFDFKKNSITNYIFFKAFTPNSFEIVVQSIALQTLFTFG